MCGVATEAEPTEGNAAYSTVKRYVVNAVSNKFSCDGCWANVRFLGEVNHSSKTVYICRDLSRTDRQGDRVRVCTSQPCAGERSFCVSARYAFPRPRVWDTARGSADICRAARAIEMRDLCLLFHFHLGARRVHVMFGLFTYIREERHTADSSRMGSSTVVVQRYDDW